MANQRYKITIAYRGTRYHGWQWQYANELYKGPTPQPGHGIPTIQETVKRALMEVLRHPIQLVGSSRTDAGVHAKGQMAHFDTHLTQIPLEGLRRSVNHALPDDILVRAIEPVEASFDAINSTVCKRYQYLIWNSEDRPVFWADMVWHRWQPLDTDAMHAAAMMFVGDHDFTSFAKPRHGRGSAVRRVHECQVSRLGPKVVIGIEGSGFLWNMIRIIVGTLAEVGLGKYGSERIAEMLAARDRRAGGPTAPPQGLYLQWIKSVDAAALRNDEIRMTNDEEDMQEESSDG
jgi:tRNA pseudouridine38-40 synthase